jgi:two-component system phosphate regulon sensor histidine kinase PhoR
MIHSLYTNKDIFMRELISNASDACDKLRYLSQTTSNLLDNDINFKITVNIDKDNKNIIIRDNGIGMNKETVKNVFEKFYRAHTGNVHNVKGFGLGMSYVKTIIDALNGEIKVDSTLSKGTVFTLEIPLSI